MLCSGMKRLVSSRYDRIRFIVTILLRGNEEMKKFFMYWQESRWLYVWLDAEMKAAVAV